MSRSFKKSPVLQAVICRSEKDDKKQWHRRLRHKEKIGLHKDLEEYMPTDEREVSNPYTMGKDASRWYVGGGKLSKQFNLKKLMGK